MSKTTPSVIMEEIGENIDRLITIDFSGRGVIRKFYDALRMRQKRPSSLLAAEKLFEVVKPTDFVLLTGGMLINPWYELGETDGPVGVAALSRALQVGLGAKPVLLTDRAQVDFTKSACRGAGMNLLSVQRVKETRLTTSVIDFPVDETEAQEKAGELIEDLNPKAIVAVERRGPNEKGVYHSILGFDMSRYEAKMGYLFEEAARKGILTIGIGDGGNEIGLARIADTVKQLIPTAEKCQCPCKSGVVPATHTDISIVSTVSNWGAYGIAASLSAMIGNPNVLHDGVTESRIIRACVDAGAMDGVFYTPIPYVDGISGDLNACVVEELREIVKGGLQGPLMDRKDYVAYARSV